MYCASLNLFAQQVQTFVHPVYERNGFNFILSNPSVENSYPEVFSDGVQWSNITTLTASGSSGYYDMYDPIHLNTINAAVALGSRSSARHFKSQGFIRTPFFEEDPVTGQLGYFNHSLFDANGNLLETVNTAGDSWIKPARSLFGDGLAFYWRANMDFFYEWNLQTSLTQQPDLATYTPNTDVLCQDIGGASVQITNPFSLSSFGAIEVAQSPTLTVGDIEYSCHYLNLNNPNVRQLWLNRMSVLSRQGSAGIFFDTDHMPEEGDWSDVSKSVYANSVFCDQPDPADCLENYVCGNQQIPSANQYLLTMTQRRRLSDFMSFTQANAFRTYTEELIQDKNPTFSMNTPNIGYVSDHTNTIVSVQDMPALFSDAFREELTRVVDLPKTEWYQLIRQPFNAPFWGNAPQSPTDTYFTSILHEYSIPEQLRIVTGISYVRDASWHRKAYVWIPYNWRKNEVGNNNSSENNRMLRTYLGFGYGLGVISSTSSGQLVNVNNVIPSSNLRVLDLDPTPGLSFQFAPPDPDPNSEITPIFDMDIEFSQYLSEKRPYNWVAVLFSERERARYLYQEPVNQQIVNSTPLNWPIIPLTLNEEVMFKAQKTVRESLIAYHQILPYIGGYEALYSCNSSALGAEFPWLSGRRIKMPVSVITDRGLTDSNTYGAYDAIVVPIPEEKPMSYTTYDPSTLLQETQDALDISTTLIKIPAYQDQQWFLESDPLSHQLLLEKQLKMTTDAIGLPPVYVSVLESSSAVEANVGFMVSNDLTEISIPITANPVWSIPRTLDNGVPVTLLQSVTYNSTPEVNNDEVRIHLRKITDIMPTANTSFTVKVQFSDGSLTNITLPASAITETSDELVISVPAFECTVLVIIQRN